MSVRPVAPNVPLPTVAPRPKIVIDQAETRIISGVRSRRRRRAIQGTALATFVGLAGLHFGHNYMVSQELTPAPMEEVALTQPQSNVTVARPPQPSAPLFSRDGSLLAYTMDQGYSGTDRLSVVDVAKGNEIANFSSNERIRDFTWLGGESTLAIMDYRGSLTVYDARTQKTLWTKSMPDSSTDRLRMSASPDGRWLALGATNGTITVLDANTGEVSLSRKLDGRYATQARFLQSGDLEIFSNGGQSRTWFDTVDILRADTWETIRHGNAAWNQDPPVVSPDEKHIATDEYDDAMFHSGVVQIGDLTTGSVRRFTTWWTPVGQPAFSPDSRLIAIGTFSRDGDRGQVEVDDVATGAVKYKIPTEYLMTSPVFSPDSKRLYVVYNHERDNFVIRTYDAETGQRQGEMHLAGVVQQPPQFSADGREMAVLAQPETYYNDTLPSMAYILNTTAPAPTMRNYLKYQQGTGLTLSPDLSHVAAMGPPRDYYSRDKDASSYTFWLGTLPQPASASGF